MKSYLKLYATLLSASMAAVTAAGAEVRTEVQFAVGASYQMPAGDFSAGTGAPVRETERRKAAGEERLRELKAREGSHGDRDATLPHAGTGQGSGGYSVITGASGRCKTNAATGYAPSDVHGAVGLANFVEVTNVSIGVYLKSTCKLISRVSLTALFSAFHIPRSQTLFDPSVPTLTLGSRI
jgi:hypothetical protein